MRTRCRLRPTVGHPTMIQVIKAKENHVITVHKFVLDIVDEATFSSHPITRWLDVQLQHGEAVVWACVDTSRKARAHKVYIRGTGHPFTGDEGEHIGTFQMNNGTLVFHLFADKRSVLAG